MTSMTGAHENGEPRTAPPVEVGAFRGRMAEVGLEGIVEETLLGYVHSAPERVQFLREALAARDARGVASGAHALRSASLNISADVLAGLLHAVEVAGREADLDRAFVLMGPVEAELERVLAFLSAEMSGPG